MASHGLTPDGDPSDEVQLRIVASLREIRRGAALALLRAELTSDLGALDHTSIDALEVLSGDPEPWRMSEFADALRIDASTATRVVERLERSGMAERLRSLDDGRVVHVRPTGLGRRTIEVIWSRRQLAQTRMMAVFDADEQYQLAALLERLISSIDGTVADLRAERARHPGGEQLGSERPAPRP